MNETFLKIADEVKGWPTGPGVYIMRDSAKRIIYVGKAKNLRNRIRSYFLKLADHTPKTKVLVKKIHEVEFTVTNTELEALLLECNLIKKHRPRYNIRLKDDKNFPYVVLDFTHPFPQFRISRKVSVSSHLKYFGPFGAGAREIGRFLLKTFQIRDCSDSKFKNRDRPCLNYEIGTCTAPCVNYVTEEQYAEQIQEASLFLKGKKRELTSQLKKQMEEHSDAQEYEKARILRDKIHSIERITQKQDMVLTEKQKDIDIVGSWHADKEIQWVILFIRGGFLTGRRSLKTQVVLDTMEEASVSFLEQFYTSNLIPDEIWLFQDFPERENIEKLLTLQAARPVLVRVPRGEKPLRLLGMAHENAKLLYQESKKKEGVSETEEVQKALGLTELPHTIEGIDVSNLQGTNPAVALVHFADERPLKSRYRLYYPKTVEGQDDFAMIHEIVTRRFSKDDPPPPDLLLIDGGKGQLAAAERALKEVGKDIPLCSLAKARTDSGFTRKEIKKSEERIFLPGRKNPVLLKEGHPALRLLQRVRDEAHRFSVKSHRARRKKSSFSQGHLDSIPGIGEKTKVLLMTLFGGPPSIAAATLEQLVEAGLTDKQARAVKGYFDTLENQNSAGAGGAVKPEEE